MSEEPEAKDFDDEHLIEVQWSSAYSKWLELKKDSASFEAMLRDPDMPIPPWVRDFLADLVGGKAKRQTGRHKERTGSHERQILAEVFQEWERQKTIPLCERLEKRPKAAAIAEVAGRRHTEEATIRGVVERMEAQGITLKAWIAWGRPNWKEPTKPE
jgi:hypothetical protein